MALPPAEGPHATRLLAIRHAPTRSTGLCVGDGEIPCTMSAQAAAARMMGATGGWAFAAVWTSPSARCREPAALIAHSMQIPLHVDERLREISLGRWQLRSWATIQAADPARYAAWLEHWLTEAPPGGELPQALLARVRTWWDELPPGTHLLISHAGVHRALRVLIDGESWTQAMTGPVPHLQGETFAQRRA